MRQEGPKTRAQIRHKTSPLVTYRYETLEGIVLYVGSGTLRRANEHKYKKKESPWWSKDLILVLSDEQPSTAHARRDEYQWIIDYAPVYNVDGRQRLAT